MLVVALLGIILAAYVVSNNFRESMPRAIIYAPNTDKKINLADDFGADELRRLGIDHQLRVNVGPAPASLSVWIIEPITPAETRETSPRGTILVLHGIQDQKTSMLSTARSLAAKGYRTVLVDSRAHGRSSGQWVTYGAMESHDLVQVLDALQQQQLLVKPVGAFGMSLGGATAIILSGIDSRVRAVVAVASFATMHNEVFHYARRFFPRWWLNDDFIERAIANAGREAGFDPQDASPLRAITKTNARVLLIHGKADKKIPYQDSEALHAAAPDHSELVLLDNEDHDSISRDQNGIVARKSQEWFDRWLGGP
jgi:dipeptidyl aminopeptidase/acylaminoacyl peptidase